MKTLRQSRTWMLMGLLMLSLFWVTACTQPAAVSESPTTEPVAEPVEMTAQELSAFNGKDGQPAYVAVDGIIYDVSDVSFWKNGDHNGFEAGRDLTEEIKTVSPHGVARLKGLPVIGTLVE